MNYFILLQLITHLMSTIKTTFLCFRELCIEFYDISSVSGLLGSKSNPSAAKKLAFFCYFSFSFERKYVWLFNAVVHRTRARPCALPISWHCHTYISQRQLEMDSAESASVLHHRIYYIYVIPRRHIFRLIILYRYVRNTYTVTSH